MQTKPRRYLITGGTSGIGAAVAAYLADCGHRVWVTGTREATVTAATTGGGIRGGSVCDVSVAEQVEAAFAAAAQSLGGLDGVFSNAGVDGAGASAEKIEAEGFRRVLEVNVVGTLLVAQAAFRHLDRPGRLVINASVNATRPERHFADYNASKAAALALARSLALDWGADGVTVSSISPGYFRTSMTSRYLDDPEVGAQLRSRIPVGRTGRPEEIGRTVEFLLGPDTEYLNGANVEIDGGSGV